MVTASQLLYIAAGRCMAGNAVGSCYLCGGSVYDPSPVAFPSTFMDYDKARCSDSLYLCQACLFSMEERSELLASLVGKDKLQRMRNYSHFVLNGQWYPLSKADKTRMYDLLLQCPELSVIAVSGQKHLIFRAQPGMWQIEEAAVQPELGLLQDLTRRVVPLYSNGFKKSEIRTGEYKTYRVKKYGVDRWYHDDMPLREWRGSPYLELAVFLAQKGDTGGRDDGEGAASGQVRPPGVVSVARHGCNLQAAVCEGDLGSVPGAPPGRGDGDSQPGHLRQLTLL